MYNRLILFLVLFISNQAFSQNTEKLHAKIDSLAKVVAELQLAANPHLLQREFGLELNPLSFILLGETPSIFSLSIGYRHFFIEDKSELAIPILYATSDEGHVFNIALQYHTYLSGLTEGLFVSAEARFTHLKGANYDESYFGYGDNFIVPLRSTSKFGLATGIGYRTFFPTRFYWGFTALVGTYLTGESYEYSDAILRFGNLHRY